MKIIFTILFAIFLSACGRETVDVPQHAAPVVQPPAVVQAAPEDTSAGWKTGYSQGTHEYSASDASGKNQLYIACTEGDMVIAIATVDGKDWSSLTHETQFDVIVNNTMFKSPFSMPSRADGDAPAVFWKALKGARDLKIIAGGKTTTISTKNISTVLPDLNAPNSPCEIQHF